MVRVNMENVLDAITSGKYVNSKLGILFREKNGDRTLKPYMSCVNDSNKIDVVFLTSEHEVVEAKNAECIVSLINGVIYKFKNSKGDVLIGKYSEDETGFVFEDVLKIRFNAPVKRDCGENEFNCLIGYMRKLDNFMIDNILEIIPINDNDKDVYFSITSKMQFI